MTAGEHFDEESLIALAEDCAEKDTYPHLADCAECRSALDEYRSMLASFADESMWDGHPLDETPNPQTIANLRAFADRMKREDAEAEPLVAELLAGSREEWMPRLLADAKFRTAGVVRRLIAAMPAAVRATPKDAVLIASIATRIADGLSDSQYSFGEIGLLRGCAWRERAFANFYVGEHASASEAAGTAFNAFTSCSAADYELARLKVLDALLSREDDHVARGTRYLKEAETYFAAAGQLDRVVSTLITRTALLAKVGDFAGAAEITERLIADYKFILTDVQRAILHGNLGYYYSERGNIVEALREYDVATFMFDSLNMKSDAIRNRWNVAIVFERAGRIEEALRRLLEVSAEFESLGMNGLATRAALGAAQIHVAREEYKAVEAICERALDQFRRTGLANSSSAMTAIALLREASRRRHVPVTLISNVAASVRDLPDAGRSQLVMQLSNDRT